MKPRNVDVGLFAKTTHNPSFASLTNHFTTIDGLRDYCIPVNNYFPSEAIIEELFARMRYAIKYYPGSNESISENIAQFAGIVDPGLIVAANGSTEIISWLNSIFIKESLFVPIPSFGRWIEEPQALGIEVCTMQIEDNRSQKITATEYVDAVIASNARNAVICNPNNPTGTIFSKEEVLWILDSLSHLDNVIIDESFIDFSSIEPPTIQNEVHRFENAWVLKSLGKCLGLHGLRMGYAISNRNNVESLKRHLPYWNVNGISEILLSLIKNEQKNYHRSRIRNILDAKYLSRRISANDLFTVFPTHSNYIFLRLNDNIDGEQLRNRLLNNQSCLIRHCGNKLGSSKQYFRIAARPKEDVDYLDGAINAEINLLAGEVTRAKKITS